MDALAGAKTTLLLGSCNVTQRCQRELQRQYPKRVYFP
jgi:hypothetical protein